MPSSATQIAREAGRSSSRSVGSHSLIAECGFACTDALAVAKPRAELECSLSRRYGKAACTARIGGAADAPAGDRRADSQDRRANRRAASPEEVAAGNGVLPSPALRGALASAGPAVPMDARVRINPVALARRTRHRVGYRALSAAIGCATGAVANVTQATYVHS